MDVHEVLSRDLLLPGCQLDGGLHRGDVAEDFDGNTIGGLATLGDDCFSFDETTWPGVEPFDLGGGDRLCSEEETGEALEADMARPGLVQVSYRGLGVGDVGGKVAGQGEVPTGEGVRKVGVVVAAVAIAAGEPLKLGFPSFV